MAAYRAGDAAAFDALYARHRGGVFRYFRRHTGNPALADELFQDVWMRLIDARARYEPQARFTTWLYTIAHNRLMDHFRAAGRAQLVSYDDPEDDPLDDLPAHDPQPDGHLERKQSAARLLAAIEKRVEEENSRPRKRYLSPATLGTTYAVYYDSMRRKIEADPARPVYVQTVYGVGYRFGEQTDVE